MYSYIIKILNQLKNHVHQNWFLIRWEFFTECKVLLLSESWGPWWSRWSWPPTCPVTSSRLKPWRTSCSSQKRKCGHTHQGNEEEDNHTLFIRKHFCIYRYSYPHNERLDRVFITALRGWTSLSSAGLINPRPYPCYCTPLTSATLPKTGTCTTAGPPHCWRSSSDRSVSRHLGISVLLLIF